MVLSGYTSKLLRWPILVVVFCVLGFEFLGYLLVRFLVQVFELTTSVRHRASKRSMRDAEDFVSYCQAARELDRLEGRDAWKREEESPYFDHALVKEHMTNLQKLRAEENYDSLLTLLKQILQTYNVGGINNSQLYSQTHFGTKLLVSDFVQSIIESLIVIRDTDALNLEVKREFFKRARKWYGRTALLLSGGAAMGFFHTGVLKTLLEAKCLPQILSGASAGSLMCAFISVRTDQEVLRDLCTPESERFFRACEEPFCVKLTRWIRYGHAFDKDSWIKQMQTNVTKGDTTFLEAYRQYGRIINVAVTGASKYSPSVLLNYRSSPDVVIWSAVLASSAFPNFLAPVELQLKNPRTGLLEPFHTHGKAFFDGTIKHDIPIKEMAKLWGANYFIVSQVNPHLVPLFFAQRGGTGKPTATMATSSSGLRGGFVLSMLEKLLKLEMGKWFKFLSDLDLLPTLFGADWRFIYLQKLSGTVTIVPNAPLWAYFRVISDPNYERMKHYLLEGERASWSKLCRISTHYRVEKTLIECSRFLEREAAKAGLPPQREIVSHKNVGVRDAIAMAQQREHAGVRVSSSESPPSVEVAASAVEDLTRSQAEAEAEAESEGRSRSVSGNGNGHGQVPTQRSAQRAQFIGAPSSSSTAAASSADASSRTSSGKKKRKSSHRSALAPPSSSDDEPHSAGGSSGSGGGSARGPSASPTHDSEEVEDVLLVSEQASSGEIQHSLTAALLGGEAHPEQQHQRSPSDSGSAEVRSPVQALWRRGLDTDTDNTDTEDEDGERSRAQASPGS